MKDLDWFMDTPIVRAQLDILKRDIVISNTEYRNKKAREKRLRSRYNRKNNHKVQHGKKD